MAFQSYIDYMNCKKVNDTICLYITGWCFHSSSKECQYTLKVNNEPFSCTVKKNVRDDLNIVFSSGIQGTGNGFYIYADNLPSTISSISLSASVDKEKEEIYKCKQVNIHPNGLDYALDSIVKEGNVWDVTGWIDCPFAKYSILNEKKQVIEAAYNLVERRDLVQFRIVKERNALCGVHFHFEWNSNLVYIHVEKDGFSYDIPVEKKKNALFTKANLKKVVRKLQSLNKNNTPVVSVDRTYDTWIKERLVSDKELEEQRNTSFEYNPKMSLVVATFNTPIEYLKKMVDTVMNQSYSNWELCVADGSKDSSVLDYIHEMYKDDRIKTIKLDKNYGIAGNMNAAIEIATGDYIGLYDHDDELTLNALYEFVKEINKNKELKVIYSDEDKVNSEGSLFFEPHFKSDFNQELLRSNNYICHLLFVKKSHLDTVGILRSEYDGAQDYDFILRCTENLKENEICHIAKILYHWRIHQNSTAGNPASKMYAFEAGIRALASHYERMGIKANVYHGASLGHYRTEFIFDNYPKVSIITKASIESSYPNYEIVDSVNQASGMYYIFLDDTCTVLNKDWLENLLGYALQKDVGAVGGRIYDESDLIYHAGFIIQKDGSITSQFKGSPIGAPGYAGRLYSPQTVSAISKECMMISKEKWDEMNGFDSSFENMDVDLCLRLHDKGYRIVYSPQCMMMIHTLNNRKNMSELKDRLSMDPYYNPNFSNEKFYALK